MILIFRIELEIYCCVWYGEGLGFVWMNNIYCMGFEIRIEDCNYEGWGINNCGYGEDLFISCILSNNILLIIYSLK